VHVFTQAREVQMERLTLSEAGLGWWKLVIQVRPLMDCLQEEISFPLADFPKKENDAY
jgi:hypothetical protein